MSPSRVLFLDDNILNVEGARAAGFVAEGHLNRHVRKMRDIYKRRRQLLLESLQDKLGDWLYTIEAWIDHFATWCADLRKRLAAQPTEAIQFTKRAGYNSVRGSAISQLPVAERADWTTLWAEVETLRKIAERNAK